MSSKIKSFIVAFLFHCVTPSLKCLVVICSIMSFKDNSVSDHKCDLSAMVIIKVICT